MTMLATRTRTEPAAVLVQSIWGDDFAFAALVTRWREPTKRPRPSGRGLLHSTWRSLPSDLEAKYRRFIGMMTTSAEGRAGTSMRCSVATSQ